MIEVLVAVNGSERKRGRYLETHAIGDHVATSTTSTELVSENKKSRAICLEIQ